MGLKWIFAVVPIAVFGASFGQTNPPDVLHGDPRLGKSISMRKSTASLSEVTREFTRLLELPIEVANDIRDRKATVLFNDRPALEAMRAIAKTLFMEWRKDGRGYRLYLTDASRKLELEQRQHEEAANRKLIMEWATRAAKYEHLSWSEISQKWMDAKKQITSGVSETERLELEQLSEDLAQPSLVSVATALVQGREGLVDRLLKGERVYFSTESSAGWIPLKTAHLPSTSRSGESKPPRSVYARLRFDGPTQTLQLNPVTYFEGEERPSTLPSFLHLTGKPTPGPLEKELAKWAIDNDQLILTKSLNTQDAKFPRPAYRSALVGVAEHLEYLADTADICIVADGFRQAASGPHPMRVGTVKAYLSALIHDAKIDPDLVRTLPGWRLSKPGSVRTEDGWLMVRHDQYWSLQECEIPERVLEKLEKAVRSGAATLNDYSGLATQATERQSDSFQLFSSALFGFSKLLFRQCWEPLLFWSTLSDAQRLRASNGALDANQLSNIQIQRLKQVVSEAAWSSGAPERTFLASINGEYELAQTQIALLMDQDTTFQDPEMFIMLSDPSQTNLGIGPRVRFSFQIDSRTTISSFGWIDKTLQPARNDGWKARQSRAE